MFSMGHAGIPGQFGEQQSHAAEIRDAGKDEPATGEGRETDEARMHQPAEQHSRQHEGASHDPHLAFQADDFSLAAFYGKIGFNPCEGSAFHDNRMSKSFLGKFLGRPRRALVGTANEINLLIFAYLARPREFPGIDVIQRDAPRLRDVDFGKFNRGPHVKQR